MHWHQFHNHILLVYHWSIAGMFCQIYGASWSSYLLFTFFTILGLLASTCLLFRHSSLSGNQQILHQSLTNCLIKFPVKRGHCSRIYNLPSQIIKHIYKHAQMGKQIHFSCFRIPHLAHKMSFPLERTKNIKYKWPCWLNYQVCNRQLLSR